MASELPPRITSPESPLKKQKLGGYDFYKSIGSPKWVVAPMVDQSELAWRMLSRSPLPPSMAGPSTEVTTPQGKTYTRHPGGAHLCYTPMIHAKVFSTAKQTSRGADGQFDLSTGEEGSDQTLAGIEGGDRPLFVQFCANDPDILLEAAKKVENHCDAVDINFGCPQGIAKRGHYGSFLQDDWDLIHRLISTLHENLAVPVTAKFRIFPDLDRTIAYAKMMEAAGAQILTCHGRTREMKGQMTGMADWEIIKEVKKALKIPVFANGNILYREDVDRCLEVTGCDGVMTAEGNLSNPALFLPPDHPHAHASIFILAHRYLDIVESLKTPTNSSAIKAHMYRMLKKVLDAGEDETFRIKIAKSPLGQDQGVSGLREVLRELEESVKPEIEKAGSDWKPPPIDQNTGYRELPVFASQPYIRAVPVSTKVTGDEDLASQEAAMNGEAGLSRPSSPKPNQPPGKCVHSNPTPCPHIAAQRCPTGACLMHCRQIRAVEGGMDAGEAATAAASGGLVGMGCEAHEAKVAARQERRSEKRKNRSEGRKGQKRRMMEESDGGVEQFAKEKQKEIAGLQDETSVITPLS